MSHAHGDDPHAHDRPTDSKRPNDGTPAGRLDEQEILPDLTHEDFQTMPIEDLADRTGLKPPADDSAATERDWREMAWKSHVQDIAERDEWGTATQATDPPKGEDPNL